MFINCKSILRDMPIDRWNNFHGYFPGGFYRSAGHRPEISRDLDRVLSEMTFDISRFQELNGRQSKMFREARDLFTASRGRDLTPEEQAKEKQLEVEGGGVAQA